MAKPRADESYSDAEADRRATAALHRALTTPYKPQKEIVGKTGNPRKKRTSKKRQ